MNRVLLNSRFANKEFTEVILPIVTMKSYVKKNPRPENSRYIKDTDIPEYSEMLQTRSLRFFQRKSTANKIRVPQIPLSPLKIKARPVKMNFRPAKTREHKVFKDPFEDERITIKRATPEPKDQYFTIKRGMSIAIVNNEVEPIPYVEEIKQKKMIQLPDSKPMRPIVKIIERANDTKFKLIQEEVVNA
ncbi:hypothetical protein SteCoe_11749 [Stentor coeruleus]|uniref:Uncharacterized protein n=1 Tax=Stentor coeruleus TaxID=5963 RepID=A0A1R2CCF3_9CILI|nr:hypothetical protein SteCoe_11749 [Stentor coeruleus]